jgi:hypothetical protein
MTDSNRVRRINSERIVWGILVGGALLLRALFATSRMVLGGDEMHYAESLNLFMRGRILEGLSDYWSFLYPFAAVPFGLIYGDAEVGLRILSILSGAALLLPCMAIAKRMWGGRAALFAGLFIALHTNLLIYSAAALTESFFSLLLMLALLAFVRAMQEGGRRDVVLTGLLLGLASLVRQEAQILLVIPLIFLMAGTGGHGLPRPLRARFTSSILLVLFFVLPLLPYALLLHEKTGRWHVQSKASVNLSSPLIWEDGLEREEYVYTLNEDGTDRRLNDIGKANPLGILWNGRHEIASRYAGKLADGAEQLPALFVTPFLLLLVPLGLFARRWRLKGQELLLVVVGVFPFVLYPLFDMQIRYLAPYLPVFLMWGGVGCAVLAGWIGENVSRARIVSAVTLFIVFGSLIPFSMHRYTLVKRGERLEYRRVGEWILQHEGSSARVISPPGTSYSYYARNPLATFIPWTDPSGLHEYARRMRFDYLVIGTDYIERYRPAMHALITDPERYGFEFLEGFAADSGGQTLVFRILPQGG